jgi:hypothetical protein
MKRLKEIKERTIKASDGWKGYSNYPFDVVLERPRPSLSKHDSEKDDRIRLHVDDAIFIVSAKPDMLYLLEEIEKLNQFKHDVMWHFSTSFFYDDKTRCDSIKNLIDKDNKDA